MDKKISELAKAVKENNLVLFVGAGLSCNFKNNDGKPLWNWQNLAKQIIENDENLACLKPIAEEYEPIVLLDLIEKKGEEAKNNAIGFAKDFFHLPADKNDYSLHKKLCRLSHKIITTNYDNAFLMADEDFATKTATIGRDYELSGLHKFSEKTLLKLHGCITDGGKMVLFPSNYTDLYDSKNEDAERILFYLQNLIANKTILFIGCGMGDFQINNIFSKVRNLLGKFNTKNHYIIAKETKWNSKLDAKNKESGFLELIPINDYSEIETVIDELLKIKEEKDPNKIDFEQQIKELKEKLENTTDKLKSLSIEHEIKGIEFYELGEYDRAAEHFKTATEFDEEKGDVFYYNWGVALSDLAKIKQGEKEKEKFLELSCEKYEKATIINDKEDEAFNNWGVTLSDLAKIKQDEKEKEKFLELACEKYEKATIINDKKDKAFYNWCNALSDLAEIKQDEKEKEKFLELACEKYEKATIIDDKYNEAFYNWGIALSNLAKIKQDEKEKEKFLELACEKYEKATIINDKEDDAFYNWGYALSKLARLKKDTNLIIESIKKSKIAYQLNPLNSYNLACGYALIKNKKEALYYLEENFKNKETEIDYIIKDEDWKDYLSDKDFIDLIEKYRFIR